jgi:hypothetical protein
MKQIFERRQFFLTKAGHYWCLVGLMLCAACGGSGPGSTVQPPPSGSGHNYTTQFPAAENPISEGGMWTNGGTNGNSWTNIRTTPGLAFGTMPGDASAPAQFADSTAVLTGSWGADQSVQASVFVTSAPSSSTIFEEVELRLRTTITSGSITGYEINCSVSSNAANNYMQIVKWNGALNNFTQLDATATHCVTGDVIKATIVGNTITVFRNGTQVMSFSDTSSPFTSGNPGMGFYLEGTTGVNQQYGFSSLTATDSL